MLQQMKADTGERCSFGRKTKQCGERVKTNAIECTFAHYTACKAWVQKRCSIVRGALTGVKNYMNIDVVKVSTMMKRRT